MSKVLASDLMNHVRQASRREPIDGDVILYKSKRVGSEVVSQQIKICKLVTTREFTEALDAVEQHDDDKIIVTWIFGSIIVHLMFDRDKLIIDNRTKSVSIKIDDVTLHAFINRNRYRMQFNNCHTKTKFIVFRQHLRYLPPALFWAVCEEETS